MHLGQEIIIRHLTIGVHFGIGNATRTRRHQEITLHFRKYT